MRYTDVSNELEQLQDLVRSEGWRVFTEFAAKEWGGAGQRFQFAVEQAAQKADAESAAYLRMVILSKKEVERLLAWPTERIHTLKAKDTTTDGYQPRRGTGL